MGSRRLKPVPARERQSRRSRFDSLVGAVPGQRGKRGSVPHHEGFVRNRLDLARQDNRHLAFGWAAHFCFGAPLARLEGQVAFATLLNRFPNITLEPNPIIWRKNLGLRGLKALHITWQ